MKIFSTISVQCVVFCVCIFGENRPVKYIDTRLETSFALQSLCHLVVKELALTNCNATNEELVAWSIKSYHAENIRPPKVFEEVILLFKLDEAATNQWIIACLERTIAREPSSGHRDWDVCFTKNIKDWYLATAAKPTLKDLEKFLEASNFGYNEMDDDSIAVDVVTIYAPYKKLVAIASKGISKNEKFHRQRVTPRHAY